MSEDSIVAKALALTSPTERAAYVDEACGPDVDLRRRIEGRLQAHAAANVGPTGDVAGGRWVRSPSELGAGPPPEGVGTRIGPYKLLQPIGEGGMGVVYMAEQEKPVHRRVALKVIKPGMDSKQVIARFEAERQALAMMDHLHIAKVFDAGTTEAGRPFFVMELVRGVPINKFCDQEHLTPRERLELFVPVCQAVQHAHQKGVIHRDLKPSNILVTLYDGKPVPKIIDFGVAKALHTKLTERTMFTEFGAVIGTLEYMAPEQAEMSGLDVDTRSDVYSLGVLLYELLTGTTPFERKRLRQAALTEVMRIIHEEEPPRPSTRLSQSGESLTAIAAARKTEPAKLTKLVRGELDWIVMKCLEKDRARRYETANGLARDVERYLADEPVEACPPSAGYRLRKLARKYKRAVGTAAAFVALLAVGVVVSAGLAVRARVAEHQAKEERDKAVEAERNVAVEKERADAINDFLLKDLLAQASAEEQARPDTKPDPNVTVRTLLDRAAERVGQKFAKQPLLEAAVRLTLGRTYQGLGLYPEAEKHLQRAINLRRQALGEDNPETWTAVSELARLYQFWGKADKLEAAADQVWEARRRLLGEEHPDTLKALRALATCYAIQGKMDKAEPLLTRLVEVAPRVWGEEDIDTVAVMNNLALVYMDRGQFARAEPLLTRCLEILRRIRSQEHPQTLSTMANLALVFAEQGRFAEAERLGIQALETASRTLGEKHQQTLQCRNELGYLYAHMGQWAKAEEAHAKNLEVARSFLGEEHIQTLYSMNNLAECWVGQGQYDRAESLLVQTLKRKRRFFGNEHFDTLWTMAALGEVYLKQNRLDRAEELLRECLDLREKVHPRTVYSASTQSLLGRTLAGQKRYAEAEPLLLAGYEVLKANAATTRWWFRHYLPDTVEWLVQLYEAWDKPEQAAKWRKELEAVKAAAKPPAKP
jgi:serine/threonine protein kinase